LIISALTRAELLALLAAAREHRERDWLLFAVTYNHALRASEAIGLIASNVSEHGIYIRGLKRGERVTQPLIAHRLPLLSERRALLAFVDEMEGKQNVFSIGRHRFWELMQHYGKQIDLAPEKRHPHALRHTCATDLTENKVPLEQIQAWTRHRSLGSLGVYLRPTQQQVNRSVLTAMGAPLADESLLSL
jgi:integrase